jgi:hypothetical protein
VSRTRLNVFLEREHAKQLDQLATMRGLAKSSIIAAALASFLSPDGADRREAAIAKRLDRLSRQFDKLERDQNILIETVSLYVRYYLSVSAPVPESHQDAARAQGKVRFEQFIAQLARHLQRGNSLVREVHEEVYPEEKQLFAHVEDAPEEAARRPS